MTYCANTPCPNSEIAAIVLSKLGYTNVREYAEGKQDWQRGRPAARARRTRRGLTPPWRHGDDHAAGATARHGRPWRVAARALTIAAVIAATLAGGYLALVSYRQVRALSVGEIRLSVSPGHTGSLDVYVPLVDWGARFESIRLPVRLRVDLRTVDRDALQGLADGAELDVGDGPRRRRATRSPPTCAR